MSLVSIENLTVSFGGHEAVSDVSFTIDRGEGVAIVGESGSGKSVTARTLIGLTGDGACVAARRATFDGIDLTRLRERQWRGIRGSRIGFVMQDALVSLDPIRPVGREIDEALRVSTALGRAERDRRVIELLGRVGVPHPELRARQLPSQLSGGLRQRALIASAIAGDPELLIADEPTTALDVTVQAQILDLLDDLKNDGRALLVISHDLAVVSRVAERLLVVRQGRVVEAGDTRAVFAAPQHEYTRALLAAIPAEHARGTRLVPGAGSGWEPTLVGAVGAAPVPWASSGSVDGAATHVGEVGEVVARAEGVSKDFVGPDGVSRTVVDDVSFEVRAGETLGIVGESGSGKTTTGRIVVGLEAPTRGSVWIVGRRDDGEPVQHDWATASRADRRALRRDVQIIYQDPLSSFDPRYTVGRVLAEALTVSGRATRSTGVRVRSIELLEQVGLGAEHLARRPLTLSGGQRQRVAIARALATEPRLILLDEPVSALDVSVQAQVLDLLADVQGATGVAYLFISHDLGVISHVSDRVLVLKDGRVVEQGDIDDVFARPQHAYTQQLLAAIPRIEPAGASAGASAGAPAR
ncbi:dipeptide ABC transporter ATP-binding protein [Okibacterium fritillariae]|uniref:Peptide/nickel transport system ATP-binding protein n=1 Tax=Okibacterium fritillariae TaxID=123320 RepID=A0A1T5KAB2_9MICO|nr:ABC transporter ATP-binding protein [Okibacterium fritillariae]SKC60633.1 peptide/nickel transport system ATP-binding protein [Okibacterium fritillariae]